MKSHNIALACTLEQCQQGRADKTAMRWVDLHGNRTDYSFADLEAHSNRFANALTSLGVAPGEVVFTFLPKMPEQFFSFLGTLKLQAICGTLFSNFGEDALLDRLGDSKAVGIVTRKSLYKKLARVRERLPDLRLVILVDGDDDPAQGVVSYTRIMAEASAEFQVADTTPDTPSVLHYTSGSTGKPKGVLHRHGSLASQQATARDVLGLKDDDLYWCTADQGWVTGTSYGIIGPWSLGITQLHYGGGYDAQAWMDLIAREKVTVWYSAPTALRMLMREEEQVFTSADLSTLRRIYSVGEPLNPEVIQWSRRVLDHDIYDTWFQTETGAIMITNRPGIEVRPGSMGKPFTGIEPAILDDAGTPLPDGEQGSLCVKAGWPSMFVTYLNNESAYQSKFKNGWYYTGDTARRDPDGYYWFMGRSDDVINTAGHLISPFEVESALLEIEEVAESGVIGAPDELLFEKVVAFVQLHERYQPDRDLEIKIRLHVSNRASSIATPQEIVFCDSIPKNKSGKIMRRVLKARYLGEDPGDTSTLEI
ncbi:AMP-binding protein [Geomesophilobacter sediminis]|uniref:acetate--CoA ligase n=1 Tax=Geomesophilobacter sediminis TaxID=2798584 RepID=A0A8J7LUG0_9BACT|nr:AMP-binding protein [Geomesophilobacter sediminis]MBJ6723700.1 AMP-binding protein [Geomesophilobacter sediminis]